MPGVPHLLNFQDIISQQAVRLRSKFLSNLTFALCCRLQSKVHQLQLVDLVGELENKDSVEC